MIGEKIKEIMHPTQYFSLKDVNIRQVRDIKFTVDPKDDDKLVVVILYVNDITIHKSGSKPLNCSIGVFEYSETTEDSKKLRRLIEVKQNEFEGLTSFSTIKKIRDQYMFMQPAVTHTLDCLWRWKELDYYCNQLIVDKNYIIVVSSNILYICDLNQKFLI